MSNIASAQAILDLTPDEIKIIYGKLLLRVGMSRHSGCELQFQQILACLIDPDGPTSIAEIMMWVRELHPEKTENSWNDVKEIDAIWH